jgi:integrase
MVLLLWHGVTHGALGQARVEQVGRLADPMCQGASALRARMGVEPPTCCEVTRRSREISWHGRPMERSEDYKAWKALLKRAGVRDARLHDARHTAGTLLVEQGVHIRVVQEILGHARVTTTERYTHVAGALMQDASTRMGTALWGDG